MVSSEYSSQTNKDIHTLNKGDLNFVLLILTQKSRPRVVLFCFSHGRFEQGMSEQCVLLDGCSKAFVGHLRWVGANFFKAHWRISFGKSKRGKSWEDLLDFLQSYWVWRFSAPLEYRGQSKPW